MSWPSVSLARITRVVGGGTPSKQNEAFWHGEIPWVSPKDMGHREVRDAEDHITQAAVDGSSTQVVPQGSVLVVVRSGILVRHLPVAVARVPVALNQDMKAFLPSTLLVPDFLAYALAARAEYVLAHCVKRGATVHSIDMAKFGQLEVPVPPLSEQRRIVELLDEADALRRLRCEADAKAERILPALFLRMFGEPGANPNNWETEFLGELSLRPQYGTSKQCHSEPTGIPVLRIPNVVRGEIDWQDLKYGEFSERERAALTLGRGDMLFVRTNGNAAYVGRCAVFDEDRQALFASYLIRVRLRPGRADPWFLAAYFRTSAGRRAMRPHIRTTAGQSNINAAALRQLKVPCPPPQLQDRFREMTRQARTLRSRAYDSSAGVNALFRAMLRGAFDGRLTSRWAEGRLHELQHEIEQRTRQLAMLPAPEAPR